VEEMEKDAVYFIRQVIKRAAGKFGKYDGRGHLGGRMIPVTEFILIAIMVKWI